MKLAIIAAACLLAGCQSRSREQPPPGPASAAAPAPPGPTAPPATSGEAAPPTAPGSAAPPAAPPFAGTVDSPAPDVCRAGLAALDQATCKTPEAVRSLLGAKKQFDGLIEALGKVADTDLRQFQVMCAQLLLALEHDAAKLSCTIPLDPRQRKDLAALIEAWSAQRTPVTPTGDAAADAVIARIVAVRDAACGCLDAACLDRVDKQLVAIGTLPPTAPEAARSLGKKLLEDASRCASRVRVLGGPPR